MRLKSILLVLSAGLILLTSCAKAIDEKLIQVAEDQFPPEVIELSPNNNSIYYSNIVVAGVVVDHSLVSGDEVGQLVSISYSIPTNINRRGKILIDDDGLIAKDVSFGNGEILYSSDSGEFSFSFSTIDFMRDDIVIPDKISGFITINIDFEDANGNVVREQINLMENDNSFINLIEPGTSIVNYEADDNIEIYGNVANSAFDFEKNDEITSLEWLLTMNLDWSQKIDLTVPSLLADGHYEVQSQEDAIGRPTFFYYPEGISGLTLPAGIPAVPPGNPELAGYFYSVFVAPYIEGNLSFEFVVVDKRDGETTENIDIASKLISPVFSNLEFSGPRVHFDAAENKYYYSSSGLVTGGVIFGGKLSNNGPVTEVDYKIRTNSIWRDIKNGLSATLNDGDSFDFDVDVIDLQTSPGILSQLRIEANNGSGTGYAIKNIYDDNVAPTVTAGSFSSNNSTNPAYAKSGDLITLSFNVSDSGGVDCISGFNDTPVVTIAGHPVNGDNGNGSWTASYTMVSPDDSGYNDSSIPYTLVVSDNVANTNSIDYTGNGITYYDSDPLFANTAFTSNKLAPLGTDANRVKVNDQFVLSFQVDRDLQDLPSVIIAGHSVTPTGSRPDYSAVYTLAGTDSEGLINYTISATDKAGNTAVTGLSNSDITFDKTSPDPASISISGLSGSTYINGNTGDSSFDIIADLTSTNAVAGDQIELLLNDNTFLSNPANYTQLLQQTHIDANSYTFTVSRADLGANGTKDLTVTIMDKAGNLSNDSNTISRTLDIVTPVAIITYSPDDVRVRQSGSGDQITISASITENDSISGSTIKVGSEDLVNRSGLTWSYDWTIPDTVDENVNYQVVINISDLAGNTLLIDSKTFILDNVAPLKPSFTTSDSYINGSQSTIDIVIDLTGTNAVENDVIELLLDGLSFGYTQALIDENIDNDSCTITVDRGDLAVGGNTLTANITDVAGNQGGTTDSAIVITRDEVPPSIFVTDYFSDDTEIYIAHPGKTVTLTFTTVDANSTPTVKIAGNPVTANGSEVDGWTSTYMMLDDATETINTTDTIIYIIDIEDNAGNPANATGSESSTVGQNMTYIAP